jgi:glutathione S-transferase
MPAEAAILNLENPVFSTYLLAASIMLLKLMIQPWITVQRMLKVGAGYRSPEDAKKSPINPEPRDGQLDINE